MIEIPSKNNQHAVLQPALAQLPVYYPKSTEGDSSCICYAQSVGVQTDILSDLTDETKTEDVSIQINNENIFIPEPVIDFKEESFDDDKEMDRILLNQISYISDDEYSPTSQYEFDESSPNSESEDEYLNISSMPRFNNVDDIIEFLKGDLFTQ